MKKHVGWTKVIQALVALSATCLGAAAMAAPTTSATSDDVTTITTSNTEPNDPQMLATCRKAVMIGNYNQVKKCLEAGYVNFTLDNGDTAFTFTVRSDDPNLAKLFLAQPSFNPNLANRFGETPLMLAVYKGYDSLFDALIKLNASPKAEANWTSLHYAALQGRDKYIAPLLKAGANPNAQTQRGVTPLMMAAQRPSKGIVDMLLKAGAQRDWCNLAGESASDYANRAGDPRLARYLEVPACSVKTVLPKNE